eukprot:UN00523
MGLCGSTQQPNNDIDYEFDEDPDSDVIINANKVRFISVSNNGEVVYKTRKNTNTPWNKCAQRVFNIAGRGLVNVNGNFKKKSLIWDFAANCQSGTKLTISSNGMLIGTLLRNNKSSNPSTPFSLRQKMFLKGGNLFFKC